MGQLSLEERMARLEDLRAIEQLKYRYAACCDTGYDLDGFRSIFTDDATWSAGGFGTFRGHDEICGFFGDLSRSVIEVLHYVTSPRIIIGEDGRSATGTFYLLCLSRSHSRKDPSLVDLVMTMGTYEDSLVKTDGRWLFTAIKVNVGHVAKLGSSTNPASRHAEGG